MKKYPITIKLLIIPLILVAVMASAQSLRISGKWKINLAKSQFGNAPSYTLSKALTIEWPIGQVSIRRVGEAENGADSLAVETGGFDGKMAQVKNTDGSIKAFTMVPEAGGKKLKQDFNYTPAGDGISFFGSETLTLSDDGRSLLVTRYVHASTGFEYTVKGWYDRSGDQ